MVIGILATLLLGTPPIRGLVGQTAPPKIAIRRQAAPADVLNRTLCVPEPRLVQVLLRERGKPDA